MTHDEFSGAMTPAQDGHAQASVWEQVCDRLPQQQWPAPGLYVVATPIGNLADLSPRAWYALAHADVIAAEDTRATRVLLDAWHIQAELISVHRHNEREREQSILSRLAAGQKVALVSDAGAPGVSDPGGVLIQAVRAAGYPVIALPGASAVITSLMAFGTTTDESPAFTFLGFLPQKSAQRRRLLSQWSNYEGTLICFEAPHRLQSSLQDLQEVLGGQREVCLARELTKRFEQTLRMPLAQAQAWLQADRHHQQGEYVLLIPPQARQSDAQPEDAVTDVSAQQWINALTEHVSNRDAARIMAKALGKPRDECYAMLLARSAGRDAGHDAD